MTRSRTAAAICLAALLAAACEHRDSGAAIPPVTAPAVTAVDTPSAPASSLTPARSSAPQAPSCRLLSDDDVRAALRVTSVPAPRGYVFPKGPAFGDVIAENDLCGWQQGTGADPGVVVQAEVFRASSAADGSRLYAAFVAQLVIHASRGRRPVDAPGLGARAARLPGWVVVLHGSEVLAISISSSDHQDPDPALLLRLTRDAVRRSGW